MTGLNWTNYIFTPAPPSLLCQFRRRVSDEAAVLCTGYACDFSPESNCANLEWRLTGIAREQLDRMPPEARAQVFGGIGWSGMLTEPVNPLVLLFCSSLMGACGLVHGVDGMKL